MIARCFAILIAVAAALLAVPATALAILVPIPRYVPSAAMTPGCHYPWAQPLTATASVPHGQPPARVRIAAILPPPMTTGYAWAQPGTAPAPVAHAQPPASVAPSSCSVY